MRIAYRLVLLGSVAACAPMVPMPPQPQPAPPPVVEPAPATPAPTPPPAQTDLSEAYDRASFDAWKQSFLERHGGAHKWEYARELEGVTPNPSVVRLDRNQPEVSRPAGGCVENATTPARISRARQRVDRVPWEVTQKY